MSDYEEFNKHGAQQFKALKASITDRLMRRNSLTVSLDKLMYANNSIFGSANYESALFVGVGHGHDALIQLLLNRIKIVDGVDPYYPHDGNDDIDYTELLNLVEDLHLKERFNVFREDIQSFLAQPTRTYDLIVLPDVLHHIYVTENILERTEKFEQCIDLFKHLISVSRENGTLIISEAPRTGLRCFMANYGLLKSPVDYRTKQNLEQWVRAASLAGWKFENSKFYVPYALRSIANLINIAPLPWFYSNHYSASLRKAQ